MSYFVWRVKGTYSPPSERADYTKPTPPSHPYECLILTRDPLGRDVAEQGLRMRVGGPECWDDYCATVDSMECLGWAQHWEPEPVDAKGGGMSDRPATDAEVAHYHQFIERPLEPDERFSLLATDFASLLARIEADGERIRGMEKVCEAAKGGCCNEEIDHDCDVRADCAWGAVCAALAALKEAPDA